MSVQHRVRTERVLPQEREHDGELDIWGSQSIQAASAPSHEGHTRDEIWGPAGGTTIAVMPDVPAPEAIWGARTSVDTSRPALKSAHTGRFLLPDAWVAAPRRPTWHGRLRALSRLSRRTV